MDCNGVVWEHFGWVWHVGFIESNYFPCQMGYLYMLGYELSIYEIMYSDVFNFRKKKGMIKIMKKTKKEKNDKSKTKATTKKLKQEKKKRIKGLLSSFPLVVESALL